MAVRLAGAFDARTGSIGFGQLLGGSLNLNPHRHTLAVDGVFEKVDGGVRVDEAAPPSKDDVAEVARRVPDRAVRWLRRHCHIDDRAAEERSNATSEPSALEACAELALAGEAFVTRPHEPKVGPNADLAAESAWQALAMSSPALPLPAPARDGARGGPVVCVDPTTIAIAHWGRLDEGELFAKSRHMPSSGYKQTEYTFDFRIESQRGLALRFFA